MRCVLVTGSWSSPTSVFALYCWGWESGNDTARLPASSLPARFPPPPGGGQWGGGGEPLLLGFTVGQLQARVGDVGTPAALTGGPFPVPGPVHTPRLLRRDCGTQGLSHVPSSCCPLFLRAPPTPLPLFSHFSPYLCDQPPGFCSWFVSTADLKRLPQARGRQQLYQDESLSCTEIQESLALSSTPTNKHIQATFAWVQLLRSPRLLLIDWHLGEGAAADLPRVAGEPCRAVSAGPCSLFSSDTRVRRERPRTDDSVCNLPQMSPPAALPLGTHSGPRSTLFAVLPRCARGQRTSSCCAPRPPGGEHPPVECSPAFFLHPLGAASLGLGLTWLGLDLNLSGLHGCQGDVSKEFCTGRVAGHSGCARAASSPSALLCKTSKTP